MSDQMSAQDHVLNICTDCGNALGKPLNPDPDAFLPLLAEVKGKGLTLPIAGFASWIDPDQGGTG